MRKNNEGRTYNGFVIVLAVIVGGCLLALVAVRYLNKGKAKECAVTRDEIMHECEIRQGEASITGSPDDVTLSALQMVMEERNGVPVGTNQYRNICIGGGVLTFDRKNKELYCSVHGKDGLSHEEVLKKAASEDLSALFEASETIVDSTKPGNQASDKIKVLNGYTWAVNCWSSGQYEIYLTDADIEVLQPGSSAFVTKYDTLTEKAEVGVVVTDYRVTEYQGGKVAYCVLDTKTFKPLDL